MTKKLFLTGIIFLVFLSISVFGLTGDVNGNGSVDIVDGLIIAQYYVGLPVSNFDAIAANVDAANGVNIVDALLIAQFYVGLINKFPADDVQPTPTPVSGSEKIINGDFSNGTANWTGGFFSPGAGSMTVSNGELHIIITSGGTATWNIQITQGNLNLISGTNYTFSFAARSASTRTIEANVGMSADPYTSYSASSSLNLSTTMTTYSFAFTVPANDATARVEFNCGLVPIDVYIDNVSLIAGAEPTPGPTPASVIINFPDTKLEAAIRLQINKPSGSIYNTDVNTLSGLTLSLLDISDITGLEYFSALTKTAINYNSRLFDVTPLANLTNLKDLNLGVNRVSNLTPLRNLTNLTQLNIIINGISDISALSNLTNLTILMAQGNDIVDITPLANLTKMTNLTLWENDIVNISALANLTNLTNLDLSDNKIFDISPLANHNKLADLNLCSNPINNITALGTLTNLKRLVLNVGTLQDITPLASCANLEYLNLDNNSISDITPLLNLTHLKDISLLGNPLNASAAAVVEALRANGTYVIY
jgi:hypothetical protein